MINPVQCGTCKPQGLNIQRPQGPQATSFGSGAGKVADAVGDALEVVAPKVKEKAPNFFRKLASNVGGLFSDIGKNARKIGTTITTGIKNFFTTEDKGFQKLWSNVRNVVDGVLGFLNKSKEGAGDVVTGAADAAAEAAAK